MRRLRSLLRVPTGDQAGGISGEQVGVLVLVAAIAGVLLRFGFPALVGDWGSYAVCSLFTSGEGCEEPGTAAPVPPGPPAPSDEDFLPPPCLVSQESEQAGYEVRIAFVRIGEDYGFIRQEFADGRVRMTSVNGASLGAQWESGTRILDLSQLGTDEAGGASIDIGGGIRLGYGDTWEFASVAEADAMREQLDAYLMQQQQIRNAGQSSPGLHLYWWLTDGYIDPPSSPTVTFSTISAEVALGGELGLRSPLGPGADGEERYLDPQVGVRLEADASYEVLVEHNSRTGTRSETYTLGASGTAQGNVTVGRGELTGESTGSVKMTYDARGQLIEIQLMSTRSGGVSGSLGVRNPVQGGSGPSVRGGAGESTAIVSTTTLSIDSMADRRIVEAALSGARARFGTPFSFTLNHVAPDRPVPDDPFQQLLYERGRTSEIVYDDVSDIREFGLSLKAGWQLGLSFNYGTEGRNVREASYLGAPGVDGVRPMVVNTSCG